MMGFSIVPTNLEHEFRCVLGSEIFFDFTINQLELFKLDNFYNVLKDLSSVNADVLSFQLRRLLSKKEPEFRKEQEIIDKERVEIFKKYYDDIKTLPNGMMTSDKLKEGLKAEDYQKELDDFMNQTIDIESFEIKESDLEQVFIFNSKQDRIPIPANYLTILDRFIVDKPDK